MDIREFCTINYLSLNISFEKGLFEAAIENQGVRMIPLKDDSCSFSVEHFSVRIDDVPAMRFSAKDIDPVNAIRELGKNISGKTLVLEEFQNIRIKGRSNTTERVLVCTVTVIPELTFSTAA
jgi:hypothetical protein